MNEIRYLRNFGVELGGPGWRKCTAYRQPGPGGLPLALRLSEGLGRTAWQVAIRVVERFVPYFSGDGLVQTHRERFNE